MVPLMATTYVVQTTLNTYKVLVGNIAAFVAVALVLIFTCYYTTPFSYTSVIIAGLLFLVFVLLIAFCKEAVETDVKGISY